MKRILFFALAATLAPAALSAQTPQETIDRAVLAAPARLRADATVLDLKKDGTIGVLRQGKNGLICWNNTGRPGYDTPVDVECTVEANLPRLQENHAFQMAGGSKEEIQARFDKAEKDKTRKVSQYGSIYYRLRGQTLENAMTHTNIAVPFATSASLGGLPDKNGTGMLWLMQPGTSYAHLMVAGM